MATDLGDNNVQNPAVPGVDESDQLESSEREDMLDDINTPVKEPRLVVGNTVISLISSMSPISKISDSLPMNTPPLSERPLMDKDMSADFASSNPEEIKLTDFTGGFVDVANVVKYVNNSTWSIVGSSNETFLQSVWSPEEIGAVVIVCIMVPFILLSNIVVIISVFRFRRLHTPTNYFITSLAAVDIFVALATPFGIVVEVFNFGGAVGPEDVVICLLPNRILMMACGVSVLTLAAIAYDRQTALVSPLEYIGIMTYKKVAILVSLTWMYSALIAWLPLMAGWYNLPSEDAPCSANLIHGKAPLFFLAAIFVPSCVAILVCYFRIFIVARHHAKAIAAVELAVHRDLQVKFMVKDTKYAKTLALVIGIFLLLWLPYLIFIFVQTISATTFNVWIQTYLILLTVFNSGINPWLYAFKNNELRTAFKKLFKEVCRSKLCNFSDRRTSLISAISGTPRMSRTDSRVTSIMPEVTLCSVDEKLKRSLDSLDQQMSEGKHSRGNTLQRRKSEVDVGSAQSSAKWPAQSHRQVTSCSSLEALSGAGTVRVQSLPRSMSVSADLTLTRNSAGHSDLGEVDEDVFTMGDGLVDQVICHVLCEDGNSKGGTTSSRRSTTASVSQIKLTSLSSVYVHLPPPPSPRRSSLADSSTSQFTVPESAGQSKENHQTSQLHNSALFPDHTRTRQQLKHTHSVDLLKEAKQPSISWAGPSCLRILSEGLPHLYNQRHRAHMCSLNISDQNVLPQNHQHTLTHTQSCPIFEPIISYQLLFPQLCCSINSSQLPSERLDFVSRVHRETDSMSRDQYLV